jgi:ureidoglycolate dehydrogenase (NAD+)
MIDLLCGAMNGMTFGRHINNMYEELDRPRKIGHLLIAIDPDRFAGADTLEATVAALVKDLRTQGDILFPGEPELIEQEKRRVSGVPIDDAAFADMIAWSHKLGVPPFTEQQGGA